jgi:small subunit ribosomal protein S13
MARIAGVTIPNDKRVVIALTYIYGVGNKRAQDLLEAVKIDGNVRVKDLSDAEVTKLRNAVEKGKVEGELRREVLASVKRLQEINSYRGTRHAKHLPVRGQSSKNNSRTVRGNVRRTMGSGRVKATKT